jgi:hypothetical protein
LADLQLAKSQLKNTGAWIEWEPWQRSVYE